VLCASGSEILVLPVIFTIRLLKVTIQAFWKISCGVDWFFAPAFIGETKNTRHIKQISIVELTTAVEISDTVKNNIEDKVKASQYMPNIQLHTKVNANLIGGFVLEFNNQLLDASIAKELSDIKKQFSKNIFIRNIR
jgi:hypothetical protein